ncbi:hypothetical protein D3C85_1531810 [compost metagenome]
MMQIPPKLIRIPNKATLAIFIPLKKLIIIIQIGKRALIIAPNPLLIYFTPQVLRPLLKAKFSIDKIIIVFHCFPFGQGSFLIRK